MKRSQLSGAQKRKHAEENKRKIAETISNTKKLTSFFRPPQSEPPPSVDIPIPGTSKNSEENFTIQEPSDSEFETLNNTEDIIDETEINRAPNQENDPGLWREFSNVDVEYWLSCGPNDCQNHKSSFEKSRRTYGSTSRYCHEKVFIGRKPNGENYKREWLLYSPSTGSLYCFVCKLFCSDKSSVFVSSTGFSDWRNTKVMIEGHEKSSSHRDCLLTYLTRRQGLSLHQGFDKQIHEENVYWEHVLQRVIAVIRTLAERGLPFRGAVEKFGSPQNGNFLALLELISQFDPFLAAHITKYGNTGKGNVSYLSKTIYEELIMIMAQEVHGKIISQIKDSRYYSLSVDSTPDLTHMDQLSVVIRYIKDGQPVERFLTFIELETHHTGDELAKQTRQYLEEHCGLDFSKCRGQSYDNASNMSGRYNGMQQKILEANPFAIYIPCAAHSLNLVGRSAVDCCLAAVNFFSLVQNLYNFFSGSTIRWRILKDHLDNESVLKSLSETRWEAHAKATSAISQTYNKIIDALDVISVDDMQKGETRREAANLSNKLQELEFVLMLVMWDEILQTFRKVSKVLQDPEVTLETCANLYKSLVDFLEKLRCDFDSLEARAKEKLPDVEYKDTRQRRRKKMPNDGSAPEVSFSPREQFKITCYYSIIDKLNAEMRKRGEIYKETADKFSFLNKIPDADKIMCPDQTAEYSQHSTNLVNTYPEDLNTELITEIQQFHSYVISKISSRPSDSARTSLHQTHAQLYKIIHDDKIESAFPNVETALRIFLSLMITNCSAERSFSKLKILKNEKRTKMIQERLDNLSILYIESDMLKTLDVNTILREFNARKSRKAHFNK